PLRAAATRSSRAAAREAERVLAVVATEAAAAGAVAAVRPAVGVGDHGRDPVELLGALEANDAGPTAPQVAQVRRYLALLGRAPREEVQEGGVAVDLQSLARGGPGQRLGGRGRERGHVAEPVADRGVDLLLHPGRRRLEHPDLLVVVDPELEDVVVLVGDGHL